MNEFTKQALAICGNSSVELEEVLQVFDDGVGFCKLSAEDSNYQFLIHGELHDFVKHGYKPHDKLTAKLAFFYTEGGRIYKDEDEFLSEENHRLAPETFIPITEYDEEDEMRHDDSSAFVCGKVLDYANIQLDGVPMVHVRLACLCCTLDLFLDANVFPSCENGNIIRGVFDVIGSI
ncbi:MAG: hypothetical protein J1F69_01605 [Clostridiales bacterium]|nr:hypothetical protein [Clostridiales bacterium]